MVGKEAFYKRPLQKGWMDGSMKEFVSMEICQHFKQKAHAQLVPVLCRAFQWKTGKSTQETKGRGRFLNGWEPSHLFS